MARKRKLSAKPAEAPQQRRRQQQLSEAKTEDEENPTPVLEVEEVVEAEEAQDQENMEAEEEEEEEGGGEDEEEEEEGGSEEEAEGDEEGGEEAEDANHTVKPDDPADPVADDDEDGDEPIQKLLEPFSKEQLVNLIREAAEKHADVADRVRKVADEDPVHRKIFVHGLGWDTNAETLTSVFKEYGEIEDCKAVSDKISGKSKGYGFILFKTRKGARKALVEPQKKIGTRMAACQLASIGPVPTSTTTAAPVPPASEYTQKKIYVSNVSADLDPQKLLSFFSRYGEIEEGPLGLDKQTGKPKGFCLFVYRSTESAKKALEEPHKNFDGHILHCQKAIDGPKPGKSQQSHHNHAPFQRNKNPNFGGSVAAAGPSHLMAPSAPPGIGMNQGGAPAGFNPAAVGQALTALLATQGAGLGLTNLLGSLGSTGMNQGVPGAVHGMQGGYGNQGASSNISPGVMGGYGTQGAYPNQQMGQGGSGRSQHGAGHLGGAPYMGH